MAEPIKPAVPPTTDVTPKDFAKAPHAETPHVAATPAPHGTTPHAPVTASKGEVRKGSALADEKDVPSSGVFAKAAFPGYFNLADLQFIYGAIRDGDYWTAFTRSIKFLNDIVNPTGNVGGATAGARRQNTAFRVLGEDEANAFEKVTGQLREYCDRLELSGRNETVLPPMKMGAKSNPVAEKANISFITLISIVRTILDLIDGFRK